MTLTRLMALTLALVVGVGPLTPLVARAQQESIRVGERLTLTPGSADTLAAGGVKLNAHGHQFDEAYLTNRAAGSTADGDVLALDSANDSSAVLDDTQGSLKKFVVATAVIANAAQGTFARAGLITAKAQGAIARGQYVRKSWTARAIEDAGVAVGSTTTPPSGALGIALAAASGGFVTIYLFPVTSSSSRAGSRVVGGTGVNNSVTPATQFDLDADEILLRDATGGTVVRVNPAALTNNISTAGPAANGRDKAGAFTDPAFLHFYWIWDGTTLATVSSEVAPPTGPTLPSGYTHWAYGYSVYYTGGALRTVYGRGAWVHHQTLVALAVSAGACTGASVSTTTLVPAIALEVQVEGMLQQLASAGGVAIGVANIGVNGVSTAKPVQYTVAGLVGSDAYLHGFSGLRIPNVGQSIYYRCDISSGSGASMDVRVNGYKVPNGGE